MRKVKTHHDYVSPSSEVLVINSEQSFLTGSTYSVGGVDNEEFVSGGTFTDWK